MHRGLLSSFDQFEFPGAVTGSGSGVKGDFHAALPRAVLGCFGTRYRERCARAWGLR